MRFGINPDDLAYDLIARLAEGDTVIHGLPLAIHATAMEIVPVPIPCSIRLEILSELKEHLRPRATLYLTKKEQQT